MRNQGGGTIAVIALAIISGIIIADILTHPTGTQAAGNALTSFAKPSYNALLGYPSAA